MILSAQTLKQLQPLDPFIDHKEVIRGRSYGLSIATYDIRIAQTVYLEPNKFKLASSIERFCLPNNIVATVKDKSSWAREGLSVFNTFVDAGFEGWLTLELKNQGEKYLYIEKGDPIAQILFAYTDQECEPYRGKYYQQANKPVEAILE